MVVVMTMAMMVIMMVLVLTIILMLVAMTTTMLMITIFMMMKLVVVVVVGMLMIVMEAKTTMTASLFNEVTPAYSEDRSNGDAIGNDNDKRWRWCPPVYESSTPLRLGKIQKFFRPFTPNSDQFQISPVASQETLHYYEEFGFS